MSDEELMAAYQEQAFKKKMHGRYTAEEAAKVISDATGERYESILDHLREAVESGSLTAYRPGENVPYKSSTFRAYYEELYWDELNNWLQKLLPRVNFQFQSVSGQNKGESRKGIPEKVPKSDPHNLKVEVDEINEQIIVGYYSSATKKEKYTRQDILGRGTKTWDLLLEFAKHHGDLEHAVLRQSRELNNSGNRNNLSNKLESNLNLAERPLIKGRKGVMKFRSISLYTDKSHDAMDRRTTEFDESRRNKSNDERAENFARRHGEDLPPVD